MKIYLAVIFSTLFLAACGQTETTNIAETTEQNAAAEVAATIPSPAAPPAGSAYELNQIEGDLYHATSDAHSTLVLLTTEGAILADPLNVGFAQWLKAELADRFNATVRYVLYSHHHWDHASGGGVFADTAELVGHANMIPSLALPMPANYAPADANGDGALQPGEATGGLARNFDKMDENGDGKITGAELNRDIVAPSITYSGSEHTVTLGGKEVRMVYAGDSHSNDSSIIIFSEYNTAFGVDWMTVGAFPRQLYGSHIDKWVEATEQLVSLEPARIVPGHTSHGHIGNYDDAVAYAQFYKDLRSALQTAIDSGVSKEEFASDLSLPAYSEWVRYEESLSVIAGQAYDLATQ